MRFFTAKRVRLLAPGALALICLFACLALRAGDTTTSDLTLAPPSPSPNPPLNVAESNKDESGNIKVHEQGTVQVAGTVNVENGPKVQDVNVTNDSVRVTGDVNVSGQGVTRIFFREVRPFDENQDFEVDIQDFSKVRLLAVVNGSDSTVDFSYGTDAGVSGSFSVDTDDPGYSVLLGDVAGRKLTIFLRDPDGEQVLVSVFGSN